MALTLYFHPLSSFCHKALIALYENGTPFTPRIVDLSDEKDAAAFAKVWPVAKFPVLHDSDGDRVIPEGSIIVEYLDAHYPGSTRFVPDDRDEATQMRLQDRLYDLYIDTHMQKIVTDRMRPTGKNDPHGVQAAKDGLRTALGVIEKNLAGKTWAMGETFTMADCAAAPGLFYSNMLMPLAPDFPNTAAYLQRLMQRPSYARVLKEAEPYFKMIPKQ